MTNHRYDLPYWDGYLKLIRAGNLEYNAEVFHSHYGLWDDPAWSNRVPADYGRAAERLCKRVCDAAEIRPGDRVLDVGCGLGTVVASLNQRISPIELVGLNIDRRQLAIARQGVPAAEGNSVEFIEGDGCRLPFAADSFDVVLALECTMHFASRAVFLSDAHRVLRPGGRLALCEHFAESTRRDRPDTPKQSRIWGSFLEPLAGEQYQRMAKQVGFEAVFEEDITTHTIPTFPAIRQIMYQAMKWPLNWGAWSMIVLTELLMRYGRLRYKIMAFQAQ